MVTAPQPRHSRTSTVLHRHFMRLSKGKLYEDLYGSWPTVDSHKSEPVYLVEVVGLYPAKPHVRLVVMDGYRPADASPTLEEALTQFRALSIPAGEPVAQQQLLVRRYGRLLTEAEQESQWQADLQDYARRAMPMCYFARGYFAKRPSDQAVTFCYPALVPAATALRKFWQAVEQQGC